MLLQHCRLRLLVPTVITLLASSTLSPVVFESIRRRPPTPPVGAGLALLRPLLLASMMTSGPLCVFTVMPPWIKRTFKSPGFDGSLQLTVTRSGFTSCASSGRLVSAAAIKVMVVSVLLIHFL